MFSIYFRNFGAFFVFLLIFQAGIALLSIFNAGMNYLKIPFIGLFFSLGGAILSALSMGGLVFMASDAKDNHKTSMSKAFSLLGKQAGAIIVVNILVGLLIAIGLCLCIIPAFFAILYFIWAMVIVVVEMRSIGDSFVKSTEFANTHKPYGFVFAFIGIAILFGILQLTASMVPQFVILIGGAGLLGSGMDPDMAGLIISVCSSIVTIPIAAFFGPFLPIFLTHYYKQSYGTRIAPPPPSPEPIVTEYQYPNW